MDISQIDSNFKPNVLTNCNIEIEWHAIEEPIFSLHGVYFSKQENCFLRLPNEVATNVSDGVALLCKHTAGGRIRFSTDSDVFAFQIVEPFIEPMQHMPITGQMGIALYTDNKYEGTFAPSFKTLTEHKNNEISFANYHYTIYPKAKGEFYDYDLYFPLYNGVKTLYIGVKKGSKFNPPKKYTYDVPVLYYGSSITQGGCAGHPGNDYQGHISRALDCDYINLGFSGNAKGEDSICDYITSVPHSVFVMDYDHNAPTVEHLEKTHYAFYKRYREKCKDTPIIFLSKPDCWFRPNEKERVSIVKNTYKKAIAEGDKNVYLILGKTLFGNDKYSCTVDSCHPNDLGFYKMAKRITPFVKKALTEKN